MRIFFNHYMGVLFGAAFIFLPSSISAAPGWDVTESPPKSIQLDQSFGLFPRLYDLYYGDGDWDLTVHEFTASRPGTKRYTEIVETTGNSITLRIPKKMIIGSMTLAPGDRGKIPVSLWYHDKKLTDSFTGDKSIEYPNYWQQSVEVIFKSSRQINEPRPAQNPLESGLDDDQILAALANHTTSMRLFSASYTGQKYCGFDVLKMADFQNENKFLTERQKTPLSYGNLLVSTMGNRVTRKILCEPTITSPICHTADYVFEWVPMKISFNGDAICEVDHIVSLIKTWAGNHAVSQTIPIYN